VSGVGEPAWLTRARDKIGLKEIAGPQHNREILDMAQDAYCGWIKDDETAWCSIFACAMLERSDVVSPRNPAARSFQAWGNDCGLEIPRIPLGAIVVFSRPPNPAQGHVGFAVGFRKDGAVMTLAGNQKNSVCIEPVKGERLIAVRWPREFAGDLRLIRTIPLVDSTGALSTNEA
jgi:uncharacterized protein (TIGR02594 family)